MRQVFIWFFIALAMVTIAIVEAIYIYSTWSEVQQARSLAAERVRQIADYQRLSNALGETRNSMAELSKVNDQLQTQLDEAKTKLDQIISAQKTVRATKADRRKPTVQKQVRYLVADPGPERRQYLK